MKPRTFRRPALVFPAAVILSLTAVTLYASEEGPGRAAPASWDSAASLGSLGIEGMECNCSYTVPGGGQEPFWLFRTEPVIRKVDREGPAFRSLEPGDEIVAIDGFLITTREAGRRLANVATGDEVELILRRRGRLVREKIVATAGVAASGAEGEPAGGEPSEMEMKIAEALEALAAVAPYMELPEIAELPGISSLPGIADLSDLDFRPLGWLGFGISFSGSLTRSRAGDSPTRWIFDTPPKVHTVSPGGPAARAGLSKGDVLTRIDGVRLDSTEGERRFSAIRPGQRVRWTVRRDLATREIEIVAEERPGEGNPH